MSSGFFDSVSDNVKSFLTSVRSAYDRFTAVTFPWELLTDAEAASELAAAEVTKAAKLKELQDVLKDLDIALRAISPNNVAVAVLETRRDALFAASDLVTIQSELSNVSTLLPMSPMWSGRPWMRRSNGRRWMRGGKPAMTFWRATQHGWLESPIRPRVRSRGRSRMQQVSLRQ